MPLLEQTDYTFRTFKAPDGFMVDIVLHGVEYTAWLYHSDYGVKELMFGIEYISFDDFKDMVNDNLQESIDNYKTSYISE